VGSALRERLPAVLAAGTACALSAAPMLVSVAGLWVIGAGIAERGDFYDKLEVMWSVLDGSHFHRLMQVGGVFDRMYQTVAPHGWFGWASLLSVAVLSIDVVRSRDARTDGRAWLLATTVLLTLGMLAVPGAVRAHHSLNVLPFLHLSVAVVVISAWSGKGRGTGAKVALGVLVVLLVAGNLRVVAATHQLIDRSGGRGRWSDALDRFAAELDQVPLTTVVSLDWGFHEPLLFQTNRVQLLEPIWEIPRLLGWDRPWTHRGDESFVYLVHPKSYDLFHIGPELLRSTTRLDPKLYELRRHLDREGELAFVSIRFPQPHELTFTGTFRIRFR
jgi:hypothetical protein